MSDKKYKILVADNCSKSGLDEGLEICSNIQLDIRTKHTEEELIEMIPEYDAMIVRSATKATAPVIEAGKNHSIIFWDHFN